MHSTCKTYTSNKLPNLNYAYLSVPVSCVHLQAVTFGMYIWSVFWGEFFFLTINRNFPDFRRA